VLGGGGLDVRYPHGQLLCVVLLLLLLSAWQGCCVVAAGACGNGNVRCCGAVVEIGGGADACTYPLAREALQLVM
jgi:hypothetical protein